MTTARAIVRSLITNGVDTVFGIPGIQLNALFNRIRGGRTQARSGDRRHRGNARSGTDRTGRRRHRGGRGEIEFGTTLAPYQSVTQCCTV